MNDTDTNTREARMPARDVPKKFKRRMLHSGSKHGPIVRKKSQMKAIMLSEARKEGKDIPEKPMKHSGRHGKMRRRKYGRKG